MENVFRYYRALESVTIASALSTALTIYTCQIRVHQHWQSKLPTSYSSEGVAAGHSGQFTPCGYLSSVNTVIHTTSVGLEHATFRSLVDCWSDALPVVPPTHHGHDGQKITKFFWCPCNHVTSNHVPNILCHVPNINLRNPVRQN